MSFHLTKQEKRLFDKLVLCKGRVVMRDELLEEMGLGGIDNAESRLVDVYIGYLRRKLGKESIATVRGVGYRLLDGFM